MRATAAPRPSLSRRDGELRELMDDPECDPERLRRTLERFAIVNRLVSGWGAVYRQHIRPLARARGGRIALLDIGCGGGDVLVRLQTLAHADGVTLDAVGIDPDERSLAAAQARARERAAAGAQEPAQARTEASGGLTLRQAYSADLVAEGLSFDVVVSNHVLHHLDEAQLTALLADSQALSRGLVLHSDIARSRTAYAAYAAGITPLAPGSFLRTDGLRSVRRSFTPAELAARVPAGWRVERPAPFRLLATWRASS